MNSELTIAIVGRPNVGKSTLFNRIVGKRLALVNDIPGLTRDRREAEAKIGKYPFLLIDTAGLEDAKDDSIEARMREQTEAAIMDADLVIFVMDARVGVTPVDEIFAEQVRISGKELILVANKAEGRAGEAGFYEAYSLGLGDPLAISAEHNEGMADIYGAIETFAASQVDLDEGDDLVTIIHDRPLQIAIVGRPNSGKSTLVNHLLGEDRMITGPEAGITRDSIAVDLQWKDKKIRMFDTAGIRRKSRVARERVKAEQLSVSDALRAIRFAEIVVILLDATHPLEKQDLTISDLIFREGRAPIIVVNKWDLIRDKPKRIKELREEATRLLPQMRGIAVVPLSAKTGQGVDDMVQNIFSTYEAWNLRISTAKLNRYLRDAVDAHSPPALKGRRLKMRYMTQSNARPPTFVLFCSRPDEVPESYKRYLINGIREEFGIHGVPIRIHIRAGENPYHEKEKGKGRA